MLNLSNLVDSLSKEKGRDEVLPDLTPDDADSTGVKDILYKLDLLTKLKAENKSKLENISPAATNPLRDMSAGSHSEPMMSTMPITEDPKMQDRAANPGEISPPIDEALPARPQESSFTDAKSVIPGPINPFEMGNSLFQTGKIATALDAYETVDMENMSVFDAAWLRYMKATCHRQLGNHKDADRIYREISKEKNVRVLVDSAKWWLKQSDRTSNFEAQLEQLQSNLDIMDERSERIENQ